MLEEQLTFPGEPSDAIQTLTKACKKAETLRTEIAATDAKIAELQNEEKNLLTITIPRLMESIGLREMAFGSGLRIELKEETFASVPKAKMPEVVEWLRNANMAGIVKTEYAVNPSDVPAARAAGITVEETSSINHNTLRAFVKERLGVDENFPRDMFNVSQRDVAVIRRT